MSISFEIFVPLVTVSISELAQKIVFGQLQTYVRDLAQSHLGSFSSMSQQNGVPFASAQTFFVFVLKQSRQSLAPAISTTSAQIRAINIREIKSFIINENLYHCSSGYLSIRTHPKQFKLVRLRLWLRRLYGNLNGICLLLDHQRSRSFWCFILLLRGGRREFDQQVMHQ